VLNIGEVVVQNLRLSGAKRIGTIIGYHHMPVLKGNNDFSMSVYYKVNWITTEEYPVSSDDFYIEYVSTTDKTIMPTSDMDI